jgi:uncharacterized protein
VQKLELFPADQVVGVFRGFMEGGMEFHADLVLPYRNDFQTSPMHGQFLLVQLETPNEAVLGRISALHSEGKLASGTGEEFNIRAVREHRSIPEELREQYLKYRVNIRVLGVLREAGNGHLTFVPSHRRLPHVGSPVAFPSDAVLCEIAGHNQEGAAIGHLAFGEYIYSEGDDTFARQDWMQLKTPEVLIKFSPENLVSRRSFVFARAGFGKSNLTKLLFSLLYQQTPTVTKRDHREVPVGTVIFDPDGEYFWPDDKGRPGLCDVPDLQDKLAVFTSRHNASPFYQSFVAGGIKLDIRRLDPRDVIAIALSPDRQDQANVRKLRSLSQENWKRLVDLIDANGHQTALSSVAEVLGLELPSQEAEALAARANMASMVGMLHDRSSQLMDMLIYALSEGKLCVVDVSQMRSGQAMVLSGLILNRIFTRNQEEFTKADSATIPTIAVIEEAQTVLNSRATSAEPYIAWVKEGRKYDLGAVLITQQPGSIPGEILSQGDNWFIFHLLAAEDLKNVQRANAHFSQDILSSLLNEPIVGQGVFWSSVGGRPYPVPLRARSFEHIYAMLDPTYSREPAQTYAASLKRRFEEQVLVAVQALLDEHDDKSTSGQPPLITSNEATPLGDPDADTPDMMDAYAILAERAVLADADLMTRLNGDGAKWGAIMSCIAKTLDGRVENPRDLAFNLVAPTLTRVFGPKGQGWTDARRDGASYAQAILR